MFGGLSAYFRDKIFIQTLDFKKPLFIFVKILETNEPNLNSRRYFV